MLDIKVIENRKKELEHATSRIVVGEYAPQTVQDRALLDLEICIELLQLRKEN